MNLLQIRCQAVAESFGLLYQTHLKQLRHYLRTTSEYRLLREIKAITDPRHLRVMWAAGLNRTLQDATTERMEVI